MRYLLLTIVLLGFVATNVAVSSEREKTGAFSPYRQLDDAAKAVFEKAFEKHHGVTYKPLCVSTQVVAGTNYRFYCQSVAATQPPREGNALIDIYVDTAGEVRDKKITDIRTGRLAGGWANFKPLDDEAKAVFDETLGKTPGETYTPFAVSTQVVAGRNYRFLCLCTEADDPGDEENVLAVVYVDLQGNKKITETDDFDSDELVEKLHPGRPRVERGTAAPQRNRRLLERPLERPYRGDRIIP